MLSEIDFGFDKTFFDDIIELYAQFNKSAEKKKNMISLEIRATIMGLESRLVDKSLLRLEEEVLKDLFQKEIITPKLYIKFMDEIEEEMFMDVKRLS
ncbi:MAG: hypothetical protein H6767_01095 [Candidatus Peribacteria bacterium]|nr:MAG: hypothetical protein H6767_01095 [Candidatus Peribacteria bacterium]